MLRAVLDTNVLVDYLGGIEPARVELKRYRDPAVSLITWMEILVGARGHDEATALRSFLASFEVLPVDLDVANRAITLRQQHRIRLPDAIIWATAETNGFLLVTRNVRDFPEQHPGIRVPYRL